MRFIPNTWQPQTENPQPLKSKTTYDRVAVFTAISPPTLESLQEPGFEGLGSKVR